MKEKCMLIFFHNVLPSLLDPSLIFEQESISFLNEIDQILKTRFSATTLDELMCPEGKVFQLLVLLFCRHGLNRIFVLLDFTLNIYYFLLPFHNFLFMCIIIHFTLQSK